MRENTVLLISIAPFAGTVHSANSNVMDVIFPSFYNFQGKTLQLSSRKQGVQKNKFLESKMTLKTIFGRPLKYRA